MSRRAFVGTPLALLGAAVLVQALFRRSPMDLPSVPKFPRGPINSDGTPAWSPDDRQIAYMTLPPGPLFVIASTGGTPHRVFQDDHHYATPAWSPDGKRLAF